MPQQQIGAQIRDIKDVSFFVKEEYFRKEKVQIALGHRLGFDTENRLINVLVSITYFYDNPEVVVAEIQVMNIFEINSFDGLLSEDNSIHLPEELMAILLPLSVTHARALFSKHLAGSAYSGVILPLMGISDLLAHFSSSKTGKGAAL